MHLLFSPVLANVMWIGGGSVGLLFGIVASVLLPGRQPVSHSVEDFTGPRD